MAWEWAPHLAVDGWKHNYKTASIHHFVGLPSVVVGSFVRSLWYYVYAVGLHYHKIYTHEWAFARVPYRGDGDRSKSSSPQQFSKMASARSSWLLFASDANATTETMLWLFCSTISPAIVIHPPPSSRGRVSLLGRGRRVIFKICPHEMYSSPRAAGGLFGHGWNCITTNARLPWLFTFPFIIGRSVSAHSHSALEIVDSEIVNTRTTCCNWLVSQKISRDDRCKICERLLRKAQPQPRVHLDYVDAIYRWTPDDAFAMKECIRRKTEITTYSVNILRDYKLLCSAKEREKLMQHTELLRHQLQAGHWEYPLNHFCSSSSARMHQRL